MAWPFVVVAKTSHRKEPGLRLAVLIPNLSMATEGNARQFLNRSFSAPGEGRIAPLSCSPCVAHISLRLSRLIENPRDAVRPDHQYRDDKKKLRHKNVSAPYRDGRYRFIKSEDDGSDDGTAYTAESPAQRDTHALDHGREPPKRRDVIRLR